MITALLERREGKTTAHRALMVKPLGGACPPPRYQSSRSTTRPRPPRAGQATPQTCRRSASVSSEDTWPSFSRKQDPPWQVRRKEGMTCSTLGEEFQKATVRPRCVNCGRCSAAHGPYRYAGWREGRRAVASGKQEAPHRRRNLHAFRRERLNMIPLTKAETCCSSSGTSTQP
jgi:hypothetical protein